MQKGGKMGFADDDAFREDSRKEKVIGELKKHFNPEFLNRIDEIITFHTLNQGHIREIINIMVDRMNKQLFERKIRIAMDDPARDLIAKLGFDEKYGARPLRRTLQREVEDYMSMRLLEGAYKEPTEIGVGVKKEDEKDKLSFEEHFWEGYAALKEEIEKELKRKEDSLQKNTGKKSPVKQAGEQGDESSPQARPAGTGQVN